MMSNSNGLNITNVNNKNLRENQQQLANDLSKQTTNKSTLSTSVSSSSVFSLGYIQVRVTIKVVVFARFYGM